MQAKNLHIWYDYQPFKKLVSELFVRDKAALGNNVENVQPGVWAVPTRNTISFDWNNRDLTPEQVFKFGKVEPQIWIYARPF